MKTYAPLTEEQKQIIAEIKDPVLWAENHLRNPENPDEPMKLRWYQKGLLCVKNRRRVVRWPRRLGKSISLCVDILHKCFTTANINGILICPYETQVREIFDNLERMIGDSPYIQAGIVKTLRNPYLIEFGNGTKFKAYTAGVRSGIKAANIRSVGGSHIWLDEADYFDDASIEAILPLILTRKDTTIWASSTPSGRRSYYYNWCCDKTLGWYEDHKPPEVSPNWLSIDDCIAQGKPISESTEYQLKRQYPEDIYALEFLAEFAEALDGVYKHSDIDECIYNYKYSDYRVEKDAKYVLGVDWNGEGKGNHFVIIRYYDKPKIITFINDNGKKVKVNAHEKYHVIYRESIAVKDANQRTAVNRIIELNKRYNFLLVAVDKGFGTLQVEDLKKYGKQHPDSGLDKKTIAIDFGSKTTVKDPVTKKDVKKNTKPLMVGILQSVIENHDLIMSQDEEDGKSLLIGQLREYRVKTTSSTTGVPTYVGGNDHIHDALLCAVFALHIKYNEHNYVPTSTHVRRISTVRLLPEVGHLTKRWDEHDPRKDILKKCGIQETKQGPSFQKSIPDGWNYEYTEPTADPREWDKNERKPRSRGAWIQGPWGKTRGGTGLNLRSRSVHSNRALFSKRSRGLTSRPSERSF